MNTQPEALRLADILEGGSDQFNDEAAAELRRLHEANQELLDALKFVIRGVPDTWEGVQKAHAAIAKAQGESR